MDSYLYGIIFIIGVIVGSFANVVTYRVPNKISLLFPGSFCDICKTKLKWYENVPLISYIIQFGKCRHCGKHYSVRYMIVEILTGTFFILISIYANDILHFVFLSFLLVMFLCLTIIDIEYFILPDKLLIVTFLICLIYYIYIEGFNVVQYLISALVILAILLTLKYGSQIIFRQETFGLGDVKLGTIIGFILGWKPALIAIFFGFLLAGTVIIILAILKKINRRSYIPFGPFMISGLFTYLFFGHSLIQWYLSIILAH